VSAPLLSLESAGAVDSTHPPPAASAPADLGRPDRRSWPRRLVAAASYLVVPLLLLLNWDRAVAAGWIPSTLIASPGQAAEQFFTLLREGTLADHTRISLGRLLQGFAIGSLLGIIVGTAVGTSRVAARLVEPTVVTLIPIPAVAWVPLLIVLFGIGELSKVLVIAIGSFCTLFLHTSHGVRSADRKLIEVAAVLEKGRFDLVRRVLLPSALPEIFAAMRIAMALSWALLIVAEVVASSSGLGWLIWDARNFSRPADMIVAMAVTGLLGKLSDVLLGLLSRRVLRWRDTYGG
jgi:sulfonate transport system permease protein